MDIKNEDMCVSLDDYQFLHDRTHWRSVVSMVDHLSVFFGGGGSEGPCRADGQACALREVSRAGYLLCLVHNQLSYRSLLSVRFKIPPSRANKDTDVTYRWWLQRFFKMTSMCDLNDCNYGASSLGPSSGTSQRENRTEESSKLNYFQIKGYWIISSLTVCAGYRSLLRR